MGLLDSIFKDTSKKKADPNTITSPVEIAFFFKKLKDHFISVDLVFDGVKELYLTGIIDVVRGDKQSYLYLDEIVPNIGNTRIRESRTTQLVFFLDNVSYSCRTSYVATVEQGDYISHKLVLPTSITKSQNRNFFRVETTSTDNVYFIFTAVGGRVFSEFVYDLSEGGVGICTNYSEHEFEKGTNLYDATLKMGSEEVFIAHAQITNIFPNKGQLKKKYTHKMGVQFIKVAEMETMKIGKFVFEKQREMLRLQKGEY